MARKHQTEEERNCKGTYFRVLYMPGLLLLLAHFSFQANGPLNASSTMIMAHIKSHPKSHRNESDMGNPKLTEGKGLSWGMGFTRIGGTSPPNHGRRSST